MRFLLQAASFEGYTLPEFIREFFRTLVELMLAIGQAVSDIVSSIGGLKIMVGLYAVLLLAAGASELKRHHRKREDEDKARQAEIEAFKAERERIMAEKQERLAGFAQRSSKKPAGKKLPASAHLTYQLQRNSGTQGARGR